MKGKMSTENQIFDGKDLKLKEIQFEGQNMWDHLKTSKKELLKHCQANIRKSAIPTLNGFKVNVVFGSNTFRWYY